MTTNSAISKSSNSVLSEEEFVVLRNFIYEQCGIYIADNRKYLIENRLGNRIKKLNLKSFMEYYQYLKFDSKKQEEISKLFEVITTNETSFYRTPNQLDKFKDIILKQIIDHIKTSGTKRLRIWSAGCSTGEEAYTIAIILHEVLKNEISSWDIKITANDLSKSVLAAAERGIYSEYAMKTIPQNILDKYFKKDKHQYIVDPKLKEIITFKQINLSNKSEIRHVDLSHIIFCRNVIIYFDDEMKRQVINSFYDNLLHGGYLFIGHSETLHNISRAFKPEFYDGTIVYRKA